MSLKVDLAYRIARRLVAQRQAKHGHKNAEAADWKTYYDWRHRALLGQLKDHFGTAVAKGKDILDFGCGDGALSTALMDAGAKSVHGVDLDAHGLMNFAKRLTTYKGPRLPTFSKSSSATAIDKPDATYDAIFCFDVLEHIMAYREIIREWHRVLRPGGSVYIWWQPYWHPFGHHAHSWVPIPWAHALLNEDEMNEVCARVVDWPGFDAPVWDRNADGTKKNRFRLQGAGEDFLNKLTVREFERLCREFGFKFAQRQFNPFSAPQPGRALSALLTKVPHARDFFMSCAVYELQRS